MLWKVVFVIALAVGQVPARPEGDKNVTPDFVENVRSNSGDSRIVSGWEAYPGQLPHHVSLRMVNPNGAAFSCGGSLVARNWVISAAHCTALRALIVVRAGVVNVANPEFTAETTEWYNYPTFVDEMANVVQPNDISLIKVHQPVTYTKLTRAIRIQPRVDMHRNYHENVLIASGHGRTWTDGPVPQVLNWVYLRGVSNQQCALTFGTSLINTNAICARYFNVTSQSTCQGDSGGPLVHVDDDGTPILVGVASFVAGGTWGCHSGLPGGFIRPGPFHDWYTQVTGLDFDNLVEEEDNDTEAPPTEPPTVPPPPPTEPPTELPPPQTEPPTELPPPQTEPPTEPPTTQAPDSEDSSESPKPDEDSNEESGESEEEEDDPELKELLKRLEVMVKVKVKMSKYGKKHKHEISHNKTISHHH